MSDQGGPMDPAMFDPTLKDEEWEKWWKQCVAMMELSLGQDSAMPHLLVMYRDLDVSNGVVSEVKLMVIAIGCDFHTKEEKHKLMAGIAIKCYQEKHVPVATVFTCEAWVNHGQGKSINDPSRVLPFDDPNATEALIAMGLRLGDGNNCRMCGIDLVRDKDGNMQRGAPNREMKGCQSALLYTFWRTFMEEARRHGTKE